MLVNHILLILNIKKEKENADTFNLVTYLNAAIVSKDCSLRRVSTFVLDSALRNYTFINVTRAKCLQ